jgi:AraC family transcriptional regulator
MILEHQNGLLLWRKSLLGERSWRDDLSYKLLFNPSGKSIYQFKEHTMELSTGESLLLNPHVIHKQLFHTAEKWIVELSPALLTDIAKEIGITAQDPFFTKIVFKHPLIHQWVETTRMYLQMQTTETEQRFWMENSLIQLALLLLRLVPGAHAENWNIEGYDPSIYVVLDALKQSYEQDWTLDDMVALTSLGKYQFSHYFKKETGLTPYSWLQILRVVRSQKLLQQSDVSILTIALEVGFKNAASYHTVFRRLYGQTPGTFRKRLLHA